jgi:hypothetical protein
VVMMFTAADRYAMASRNSLRVLSLFMSCSPVHGYPVFAGSILRFSALGRLLSGRFAGNGVLGDVG